MLYKFNACRRHKFEKTRYRVTNRGEYNESLRKRDDLTIWITAQACQLWGAQRPTSRGGQPRYSDKAIMMCLTLGMFYRLPLRQTQGLMRSIFTLMQLEIPVPDFSTLSRRSQGLRLPTYSGTKVSGPIHLVVDSTGLKIFREGEWLQKKHKIKAKRKAWCKLHLGPDLLSGEIVCASLTKDDVGDPTALPGLPDQLDVPIARFLADGAYDGAPTNNLLKARFGGAAEIIIPPPRNATPSLQSTSELSFRDRHIGEIHTHGRMAWQSSSGYNQRSRLETQMGRWKAVIGPKLRARSFQNQKTEAKIGVRVLSRMTEFGRPTFERIA